jgi:putative Mn2+ efflux pump MntP|tara:strand:- start:535 stop:759 length:225 start_codon:yes stop_codon:yes gene_type:complete
MKYIKKFINWLGEILKETLAQTFTLLGFFIAWLTLTGTAKDIVGVAILISLGLWLLTIGLRKDKPQENKKKASR